MTTSMAEMIMTVLVIVESMGAKAMTASMAGKVMTISTETKVMTPSGAKRRMILSMVAPVMMNSVVIAMKTIVRTMRRRPYPV